MKFQDLTTDEKLNIKKHIKEELRPPNGSRLCEAVDVENQMFNLKQKIK